MPISTERAELFVDVKLQEESLIGVAPRKLTHLVVDQRQVPRDTYALRDRILVPSMGAYEEEPPLTDCE